MPRLSRDVVAAREKLAHEMFVAGKSQDDVQKALQDGWNGMKMAPGRLAELQQEAQKLPGVTPPAAPTVTLVNPLSSDKPITLDANGNKPVEPSKGDALPDGLFSKTAPVENPESTKTFNPVADGFLDFCRAKAKAAGLIIVDVSEELYEEWLATKK